MIDRRKKYFIIYDTETANTIDDPLVYDIGWKVCDTRGNVYEERSFLVREIFCGCYDLMKTAYYADKLPIYRQLIKEGKRKILDYYDIKRIFAEDIKNYGCIAVCAHNAIFDYRSISTTQRYITSSKSRYFLPYGIEIWDTMKMAQDVICQMPTYRKFCEENGYICKNGQLRKTAEILYRFITKDVTFEEDHCGLEDVEIERQIYIYCERQHKKMRKKMGE